MGIILKGNSSKEQDIKNLFAAACKKKEAKRAFGYLLYELAGLADLAAMENRLDEIDKRLNEIKAKPGMRTADLPIEASSLKNTLIITVKNLCASDYEKTIAVRKKSTILNASNWVPSNVNHAATVYLRNLMRKFAEDFITEAGGQS